MLLLIGKRGQYKQGHEIYLICSIECFGPQAYINHCSFRAILSTNKFRYEQGCMKRELLISACFATLPCVN